MTNVSVGSTAVSITSSPPLVLGPCVLNPTQAPAPPPSIGQIWVQVAPGISYESFPDAPVVIDTSPDQVIGCIFETKDDPQARLNAFFPLAESGDGVIERSTADFWVFDGSQWNNVGPTPGPTVLYDRVLPVWNETVKLQGITKTNIAVISRDYALELLTNFTVKTKTSILAKFIKIVRIQSAIDVVQQALPPGKIGEFERIIAPNLSAIIYSQSSVANETSSANAQNMQDRTVVGTATGAVFVSGQTTWIKMDLGDTYTIDRLVIGTATTGLPPGGWTKANTENLDIQYSNDNLNWITAGTTGTFPSEGIYQIEVNFTARYLRVSGESRSIALTELYALSPKQENPIDFGPRVYVPVVTLETTTQDPVLLIGGIYQEEIFVVSITAQPPFVATGVPESTSVEVPISVIDMSTGIPTVGMVADYWSEYYNQSLGWESIFMPDGWVN